MSYTSFMFLLYFPISVMIYWLVNKRYRLLVMLLTNIIFILSFSVESLLLVTIVSLVSYISILLMRKYERFKSIISNIYIIILILLFMYLKFSNYFITLGNRIFDFNADLLSIIASLGFSFYMIQNIMLVKDYENNKISYSEISFLKIFVFNSNFLTIIQGPINKYQKYIGQLNNNFSNEKLQFGIMLMVIGLFKKLIISSRLSLVTSELFTNYANYSGKMVILAAVLYTIELYFDFMAAVDISRGISYMYNIELPINFNKPYSAVSIRDFWSRWHITLTTFFREYLYFPLGGSRKGKLRQYLNIYIVFIASAIWHGTGVNFLVWGLYQASLQVIESILNIKTYENNRILKYIRNLWTLILISFGWLMFNASGFKAFIYMVKSIFIPYGSAISFPMLTISGLDVIIVALGIMLIYIIQEEPQYDQVYGKYSRFFNYKTIYLMLIFILIFGMYGPGFNASDFIYMGF